VTYFRKIFSPSHFLALIPLVGMLGEAHCQGVPLASQISSRAEHTCIVRPDANVACWGSNNFGELGDGTRTTRNTPVRVLGLTDVLSVSVGGTNRAGQVSEHSCAVLYDMTLRCWGNNTDGQLGDGTFEPHSSPAIVLDPWGEKQLTGVASVVTGGNHTCALLVDGTVYCWGDNLSGQLGVGVVDKHRPMPQKVMGLSGVTQLIAGGFHNCAVLSDGSMECWGAGAFGQLGNGLNVNEPLPALNWAPKSVVAMAAGEYHTCAVSSDGELMCWGKNDAGQLGDLTVVDSAVPEVVLANVSGVATGESHTCAVMNDTTVRCFGKNNDGQIGNGTRTAHVSAPAPVLWAPGYSPIFLMMDASAGSDFTCTLGLADTVGCWGSNASGQLGDGTFTSKTTFGGP
jgi:alpha-tubulin suppressor-like RCC1 family protein